MNQPTRPDKQASLPRWLLSETRKGTPLDPTQDLEFQSTGPGTFVPLPPLAQVLPSSPPSPPLRPRPVPGGASCQGARAPQPALCAGPGTGAQSGPGRADEDATDHPGGGIPGR